MNKKPVMLWYFVGFTGQGKFKAKDESEVRKIIAKIAHKIGRAEAEAIKRQKDGSFRARYKGSFFIEATDTKQARVIALKRLKTLGTSVVKVYTKDDKLIKPKDAGKEQLLSHPAKCKKRFYRIFYQGYYQPHAYHRVKPAEEEAVKALSCIGGKLNVDTKNTDLGILTAFNGTTKVLAFSSSDACRRIKARFVLAKKVLEGAIAIPAKD